MCPIPASSQHPCTEPGGGLWAKRVGKESEECTCSRPLKLNRGSLQLLTQPCSLACRVLMERQFHLGHKPELLFQEHEHPLGEQHGVERRGGLGGLRADLHADDASGQPQVRPTCLVQCLRCRGGRPPFVEATARVRAAAEPEGSLACSVHTMCVHRACGSVRAAGGEQTGGCVVR